MSSEPDPLSSAGPDWRPRNGTRRGRIWLIVATVALAAAFTGTIATTAVSHYGFGGGHWRGPGMMGGAFDPAEVEERADRMVRHLAIEIDASAEQQQRLRAIVKAAVKDLLPMREKFTGARERARSLLTTATFDRAAVETFRTEQLALADAASKRFAQALGDAVEVLTAEQRRKVDDRVATWRAWRGWHRG